MEKCQFLAKGSYIIRVRIIYERLHTGSIMDIYHMRNSIEEKGWEFRKEYNEPRYLFSLIQDDSVSSFFTALRRFMMFEFEQ